MKPSTSIARGETPPGSAPGTEATAAQPAIALNDSRSGVIGVMLFCIVAGVFYLCPVHYLSDSGFSLMMDEAIIHEWTPDMASYQLPRGHGSIYIHDGYPWNIKLIKGRLLYVYPWGSSLLSLPLVGLFNAARFRIAPHHKYNGGNEVRMQAIIAAGLGALTIWVFYETAGALLTWPWPLVLALGAAFGTSLWSSASRSLWPQTWAVLLTAIAIWILLSGRIKPLLLGTVLAWSCLVRPQVIPDVAAITGYLLVTCEWGLVWRYAAAGICWTIPVCALMRHFTGGFFSALYSPGMLDFSQQFWWRLYGLLLSPARGLVVFSPVVAVPLYLIIRYWKVLPQRRLTILALVIVGLHLVMLSCWVRWWGGGSYGPRLLLETVPWFVLLAILGLSAYEKDRALGWRRRRVMGALAALSLAASIGANIPGALAANSISWRKDLDIHHLGPLWDWHDPQFLCWISRLQK